MKAVRRLAIPGLAALAVLTTIVPMAVDGRLGRARSAAAGVLAAIGGLALLLQRRAPLWGCLIAAIAIAGAVLAARDLPSSTVWFVAAHGAVAGYRRPPRPALAAAAAIGLSGTAVGSASGDFVPSWAILALTGWAAGAALRQRDEAAARLAERARELEDEREVYAELSVRYERARIAAELHDIVGHAISVMIVQAAAGQRLVDRQPERVRGTFNAIAEAARVGSGDLVRLVALLSDEHGSADSADLMLVDELVARASATGLHVTYRVEGDPHPPAGDVARVAYRVVQEGLTNALRHAPGAAVRIVVKNGGCSGRMRVTVENDLPRDSSRLPPGTGFGLRGLRERVAELGGSLQAGPRCGGWVLEADLGRTR